MARTRTYLMQKLLAQTNKCELCGNGRNLEVHHIVPVACGGSEDDVNNLIVVCSTCHIKLTPKSFLTKMGFIKSDGERQIWNVYKNFYHELQCETEIGNQLTLSDTLDIFDEVINKLLINVKRRYGEISDDEIKKYKISIIKGTKELKEPKNKTVENKPIQMTLFDAIGG